MLLALALLLGLARAAFTPYVDVPYEEIVSQRFTLSSAAPIFNWGQLPFDNVTQVAYLRANEHESQIFPNSIIYRIIINFIEKQKKI